MQVTKWVGVSDLKYPNASCCMQALIIGIIRMSTMTHDQTGATEVSLSLIHI